jgi:hypothetical protein
MYYKLVEGLLTSLEYKDKNIVLAGNESLTGSLRHTLPNFVAEIIRVISNGLCNYGKFAKLV